MAASLLAFVFVAASGTGDRPRPASEAAPGTRPRRRRIPTIVLAAKRNLKIRTTTDRGA